MHQDSQHYTGAFWDVYYSNIDSATRKLLAERKIDFRRGSALPAIVGKHQLMPQLGFYARMMPFMLTVTGKTQEQAVENLAVALMPYLRIHFRNYLPEKLKPKSMFGDGYKPNWPLMDILIEDWQLIKGKKPVKTLEVAAIKEFPLIKEKVVVEFYRDS